jgi:hypothetical protein
MMYARKKEEGGIMHSERWEEGQSKKLEKL